MIPVSQAFEIVKQNTPLLATEKVALEAACQRVLAQPIIADMDLPPFNRSQMDGYAVKATDTKNAPVRLRIVGESAAGKSWNGKLKPGEAVRIMTGAALPEGASAVQKLEVAEEKGDFVEIYESANKGQNIVARGAEIETGKTVFSPGENINASMIAGLAAFGYSEILVSRRPTVAILSTGNEIVNVNQTPQPDQIRNSNTPMLRVHAEQCGSIVKSLPIAGDDLELLKKQISEASTEFDVLVLTGGVSVGKYDLTKLALNELGAIIYFEKIALRPGKPMVFARLGEMLIFALPGNPVSATVTFLLFVRMALLQMQGAHDTELKSGAAIITKTLKAARERDSFLPVTLLIEKTGQLVAEPLKWGGSSDFISFAQADALVVVPQNTTISKGDAAKIFFLK